MYHIPLIYDRSYVGQTGGCINDREREHARSVNSLTAGGRLPTHCLACQRWAQFCDMNTVARISTKLVRESLEALSIEGKGDDCISALSLALHEKEKDFPSGS